MTIFKLKSFSLSLLWHSCATLPKALLAVEQSHLDLSAEDDSFWTTLSHFNFNRVGLIGVCNITRGDEGDY